MKKALIIFILLFCSVMTSFRINNPIVQNVLVVAEPVHFEIKDLKNNNYYSENENIINTSLEEIGIVTYINPETNQFAALGHSIVDGEEAMEINGLCYNIEFQHSPDNAKDITNLNLNKEDPIGYVYYDNYSGVYGKINNIDKNQYQIVQTANRYEIKKGKASILVRLDGNKLESYEVQIVGINYFASNKNIRVKITDERLINETGGIVQGMSGTPVMQNGKLVGAINCVNICNAKDAYAIFIDKII